MTFPSTLTMGIPGVMDPAKFDLLDSKLGSRAVHQECDGCPNDANGCARCRAKGGVVGKHPRPIARVTVDTLAVRRQDGRPIHLEHRMLTSPLTLTATGGEPLAAGVDYQLSGRNLSFTSGAVSPGEQFRLQYEAYAEDWVNLQHAYSDFAGGGRKSEYSSNLRFANLEQGIIAMSIGAGARGYHCKTGDRYIPVDATMRFSMNVDKDRQNIRSRHQFVGGIVRAYGVTRTDHEVELTATWNRERLAFDLTGPDYERAVIIYDACPVYTVYLDMGEFRHPQSDNHHRLVLLTREEIGR